MLREELSWYRGPITHAHIRYPGEVDRISSGEILQFDHETALQYLKLLTGRSNLRITDTNHAMLSLDVDNLEKPESESKEIWREKLINQASEETAKRIAEIRRRSNPNIIVGVEVDIIDSQGGLSLSDECLGGSDFTIASFHRYIWSVFSGRKHYQPEELIEMYMGTLDNPNVCVLGHPTNLSSKMVGVLKPEDYSPVIKKMTEKGVAYEISILKDLSRKDEELTRGVLRICGEKGTPLVLSTDFHNIPDLIEFGDLPGKEWVDVTEENLKDVFAQNAVIHYSILRRLIRNIDVLRGLDINEEQVVNSSDQRFDDWLNSRKFMFSQ